MARGKPRRHTPQKPQANKRSRSAPGYRIFISYSHGDLALVKEIDAILHRNGLNPQIGFASALNIPVLPIAVGKLPGEMIQQIHAVQVRREDLHELEDQLTVDAIRILMEGHAAFDRALYVCAATPEERATLMAAYANDVFALGVRDLVRQKGGLSSFQMPSETVGHPVWAARYGKSDEAAITAVVSVPSGWRLGDTRSAGQTLRTVPANGLYQACTDTDGQDRAVRRRIRRVASGAGSQSPAIAASRNPGY